VNISVNDVEVENVQMKLGSQGEAFFVIDIDDEDQIPPGLITSPLPSRPSTPKKQKSVDDECMTDEEFSETPKDADDVTNSGSVKRRRRKKRKKRNNQQISCDDNDFDDGEDAISKNDHFRSDDDCEKSHDNYYDVLGACVVTSASNSELRSSVVDQRCILSDSEVEKARDKNCDLNNLNFSDTDRCGTENSVWGWGQLPENDSRESSTEDEIKNERFRCFSEPSTKVHFVSEETNQQTTNQQPANQSPQQTTNQQPANQPPQQITNQQPANQPPQQITNQPPANQLPQQSTNQQPTNQPPQQPTNQPPQQPANQPPQQTTNQRQQKTSEGLYLDDVLNLDPSQADLYLKVI